MNKIIKGALSVAAAGALVMGVAGTAQAVQYTGKIQSYVKDTDFLNPYGVTLVGAPQTWMYANTFFISCTGAGISDGSPISMTRLGQVKSANKTVRINTTGQDTITCL